MVAIPLRLLLNKLHLFRLTQHTFNLIQIVAFTCVLYVSACTRACQYKSLTKEDKMSIPGAPCFSHYFYTTKI